jgi:predicted glycogen debranching enzyme
MIKVAHDQCADFDACLSKEWLDTNGLGGYSSSTLVGCHTRKYHGLLIANLDTPPGRFVLLSTCEETVSTAEKVFHLSVHRYPGTWVPGRYTHLENYVDDCVHRFTYHMDGIILHKELMLVHGEDTLLIRYCLSQAPGPVELGLRPLCAWRNIHELTFENPALHTTVRTLATGCSITPYQGMPALFFQSAEELHVSESPAWYNNFEYPEEEARGYPYREDLFSFGTFAVPLSPESEFVLSVSLREQEDNPAALWKKELQRRKQLQESDNRDFGTTSALKGQLLSAARQFVVKNRTHHLSIIAGYHWFYEWGRDTLISLPGLTLYTGRIHDAIEILTHMAALRKDGVIPNCLSDSDDGIAYNSVDASLWYFWCLQELLKVTGDYELLYRKFWPVITDIITSYYVGSPDHVTVLDNGMLRIGSADTQLTWMDAAVEGHPVTPRYGCPIEITALWFNALCFVRDIAHHMGTSVGFDIDAIIQNIRTSFMACYWIEGSGYLADVWLPDTAAQDTSFRPNQILAISLPYSIVNNSQAVTVIQNVTRNLLTPCGLRTLSPHDPHYHGSYAGTPEERDAAYHQGTVWPWLLGHYGEALLKTTHGTAAETLAPVLKNIEDHLLNAGLGSISEIFSGDYPFEPRGCIAQAWSVAEVLRLCSLMEEYAKS